MGAAARALLPATLRPRWCALSLCQRLLAIAADYCSALLRAALVAVAVAWFAVAACCSQRAAACSARCGAFEVSKQYALFECATVAQCCYGQEQCQVNCAFARRATQAASHVVAVVRVRRTRPTNASRAAFRPLASAPDGLDAYDATPSDWKRAGAVWCVDGFTRLKRSSYARSCSETLRHICILANLHIRKRKRRVQTSYGRVFWRANPYCGLSALQKAYAT